MEAAGAELSIMPYHGHYRRFYDYVGSIKAKYNVLLAGVRFFNYYSFVPWICRLQGIRNIVLTEANSGQWLASEWRKSLFRLRTRAVCAPLTRAIAISRFVTGRLVDLGIPESKIRVVYNGIDVDTFVPNPDGRAKLIQEFGGGPETIFVSYISAMFAWKQPDVALNAARLLLQRGRSVKFLIAGDGPLLNDVKRQTQDMGLTANVHCLGRYPDPQILLQGSDIFLHCAVGEAFGNVLAEAMACGLPIVVARSGAAPEIARHGQNGLIVDTEGDQAAGFADAIDTLILDPDLRRRLGEGALVDVHARFSVERAVAGTLVVYGEVLGRSLT